MKRKKAGLKTYLCMLLALTCLCGCGPVDLLFPPSEGKQTQAPAGPEKEISQLVAYVPLDNRSVNVRRVAYLAESVGYTLRMPDMEDYVTRLDGQPQSAGPSGADHGNRLSILSWLQEMEAEGCNHYVLSLDQLMSGGLTSSRFLTLEDDLDFGLTETEAAGLYREILDFLAQLAADEENRIYLLDTVMRLCFTDSYGGCDLQLYGALRHYSRLERPEPVTPLDPRQIAAGYPLTPEGAALGQLAAEEAELLQTAELRGINALERFHGARLRKLYLIRDVASALGEYENVCFFIGVDDSGTEKNIQTADIQYIEALLQECAGESFLYDGADELGMCAFSRLYGEETETLGLFTVSVQYFGGGEDAILSNYDSRPLNENIASHVASLGADIAPGGDISLLVLTGASGDVKGDCARLAAQFSENVAEGIPTVILDASCGKSGDLLAECLMESGEMTLLFGFSSYNTLGNSIGISLSMGLCRLRYLKTVGEADAECSKAHLRSLALAYLKEFCYKGFVQKEITASIQEQGLYSGNFYADGGQPDMPALEAELQAAMERASMGLCAAMGEGTVICSLAPYSEKTLGQVGFEGCSFPWYRTFEIDFSVSIG